ncbi:hypothetical protein GW17_00008507 [Ensete ventricosum]|nr:hypothetical protein GW17_00008507 [Ensete ventricosum]
MYFADPGAGSSVTGDLGCEGEVAGGNVDEDGARGQAGESSFGGNEGDSVDVGRVADDEVYDIAGAHYEGGGAGEFGTPVEPMTPVPIQPIRVVVGHMVDLSREQRPWRSTDGGSRTEGGGDGGGTPGSERVSGVLSVAQSVNKNLNPPAV